MRDRCGMLRHLIIGAALVMVEAGASSCSSGSPSSAPALNAGDGGGGGGGGGGADAGIESASGDAVGGGGGDSDVEGTDGMVIVGTCPQGTALADGCPGAPSGVPQLPNLLDLQKVVMLNILPGTGYTNGTYNWTTTGGGGSGAAGTVTVTGGMLGGQNSQGYTISDPGSGYTSRPTISVSGLTGGSGGSITPSVYQATPHNAATRWNMPGVDYYVGIPSGTSLKDPTTSANLPTGAAFAGSTVNVTGCNVTLDSLDFSSTRRRWSSTPRGARARRPCRTASSPPTQPLCTRSRISRVWAQEAPSYFNAMNTMVSRRSTTRPEADSK